jgi:hypothetical protein
MITDQEREKYTCLFNEWARTPKVSRPRNTEAFRDSVLEVFSKHEERQRNSRNCAAALDKALRRTQNAIEALSTTHAKGYSNAQTKHLLTMLEAAHYEAGEPKEKSEVHKSYYDSASGTWMHSMLTATNKKARSPRARLIFDLEALWFSEFRERPNTADEPQFYIFAGQMMGVTPEGVRKQRSRTVKPT